MDEMYSAMPGSPITYLAGDISAGQTTIAIADDTALPDAPNICTIGYGENIETIRYGAKSNGVLQNVTRGIEGTPRAWQAGTEVARFYTAYDHNAIVNAIMSHKAESATQAGGIHGFEYEEGEWTPTINGATLSQSTEGRYIRKNKEVTAWFYVSLVNKGSATDAFIRGLPFVCGNSEGAAFFSTLSQLSLETKRPNVLGRVDANTSMIRLRSYGSEQNASTLGIENITDNTIIAGVAVYITN